MGEARGVVPGEFEHVVRRSKMPVLERGVEPGRHPVLVCGGGPVGLAVALGLARRGVRSVVVEADDTVCVGSRAICLSRRTLEILDRLGALPPFLAKGLAWTGGRSFHGRDEVLRFAMPHDADQRLAPMTNLQQYYVEAFLLDAVARYPDLVDLRWSTRLTALAQGPDHVRVDLASPEGDYAAEADYVVACDGARSAVRGHLGHRMSGTAYEGRYVIADIHVVLDWPTERLAWFDPPSAPGRTVLMHRQPDDVWRIDYQLDPGEDPDIMVRPEHVAPIVAAHLKMLGIDAPWRIVWTSVYRAAALSMDRYRDGRVLFAGDAAHLVPIFGVRGLNGGFDDAFNLAWKLAYVAEERAGAALLDSYSAERRGAWAFNVAQAMKSTEFMAPPSRGFAVMREAVLSLAADHPRIASLISPRQSNAVTYAASPLNTEDAETEFAGGPVPGAPVPEVPLRDRDGRDVHLTQLLSDDFTLLVAARGNPGAPEAFATPGTSDATGMLDAPDAGDGSGRGPDVVIVHLETGAAMPADRDADGRREVSDHRGRFAALFEARPGSAWLVRPDGHVAARWRAPSAGMIAAALRRAVADDGAAR